jgi:hypothetical protein
MHIFRGGSLYKIWKQNSIMLNCWKHYVLSSITKKGETKSASRPPVWVLEDWWPTIRDLTLCWEFCKVWHWKRQYEWYIKIYMPYDEEKGKSHEDLWGLKSFYFIKSYELCTIKGDALGVLVKCKKSKSIHKPKFPEKLGIFEFLTGFQKLFSNPDMSGLAPAHQRLSPSRTYLAQKPCYRNSNRGYPASQPYPWLRPETGLVQFPSRVPERFARYV